MRLDQQRQKELSPKRSIYACGQIEQLGYTIIFRDETTVIFEYKGSRIHFYPYSGWATGKTINDGRGLENLLKQIK